jgi:hypothetical protein
MHTSHKISASNIGVRHRGFALVLDRVSRKISGGFKNTIDEDLLLVLLNDLLVLRLRFGRICDLHGTYMQAQMQE